MFDPREGSQVSDLQPGTQPNGLFWTTVLPKNAFRSSRNHASLHLHDFPLVETFQFQGPNSVPGTATLDLHWRSKGERVQRGKGTSVEPEDMAAFEATFSEARCTGRINGERMGFNFRSGWLTSDAFYASMGEEQNGVWMS